MPFSPRIVLITAPSVAVGRQLARIILEARLAACVNIAPGIESHYWWQGKLASANEVLLLVKSSAELFEKLRALVSLHHPYACPEIVAFPPGAVSPDYLAWWEDSLKQT